MNTKKRSSRIIKGRNVMESVPVDRRNVRFVAPVAPERPYSPPDPQIRRAGARSARIQRPLDPRASRPRINPRPAPPINPPHLPKPVASRVNTPAQRQISREDFIRNTGLGGAALFAGAVGLRKKSKKTR
jgi:hypothetical protein